MKMPTNKFFFTLTTTVALFFSITVNAQNESTPPDSKDTRLGIGLSFGVPTGNAYNIAIGGDLRLQQDFSSNVSGLLGVGYTNFSLKGEDAGSIGFIPVKVGIKVFPVERFYLSGEVGAGFGTDKGAKTSFLFAPGIGLGFNNGIDLGLRYESFTRYDLGQVALRIAYGFNLSR